MLLPAAQRSRRLVDTGACVERQAPLWRMCLRPRFSLRASCILCDGTALDSFANAQGLSITSVFVTLSPASNISALEHEHWPKIRQPLAVRIESLHDAQEMNGRMGIAIAEYVHNSISGNMSHRRGLWKTL